LQKGAILVVLAAMLWGTTGTSQALAPSGANALTIGALRLLVGGVGLLVIAHRTLAFDRRWLNRYVLIGAAAVALYQVSFFGGVGRTGVAVGTVVGIGSAPIFAGLLALFVERIQLTLVWWLATGLAVAGGAILALSGSAIGVDVIGILLAMGAGLSYAIYALASKTLLEYEKPDAVMAALFSLGALLLLPLLLTAELHWVGSPGGLIVVLHLGLLATTLSYALFARGLRDVTTATAITLSLAEPLTAALLGIFVLGEPVTAPAVLGIGMVFVGLYLVGR
jgi:DME family drug/metabolite transporter